MIRLIKTINRVCGENGLDLGHTYPNRIPRLAFVTADKSNKYVNPNQNFKLDHDKSHQNVLANVHMHPNRNGRFVLDKANRNKVFTHDDDGESCSNSVHTDPNKEVRSPIDIANCGHDKFLHSLLFHGGSTFCSLVQTCESFNLCKSQSKFDFCFIPLTDSILPMDSNTAANDDISLLELYGQVKAKNAPNILGACIPLISQLNVSKWEEYLDTYWDKQLLQFLKFGFPTGFNRDCQLHHTLDNQKSATEYPDHVQAYLEEEVALGAIVGPFKTNPIPACHTSPFMTRPKPQSDTRHVIVNLSWPKGASVNDEVDKHGYMGVDFLLTFPTVDHLTAELTKLGCGAHIFKIDVSRAFCHLKIDPYDFDLLGLNWNGAYIDTCLPFGTRHGSQFFQRTSDAVCYIMHRYGFDIINYIDDFLGFGTPSTAQASFKA